MVTVALTGADGSGKSTVAGLVVAGVDGPVRRMYLGVSAASATHPLPTTRLLHRARVATGRGIPDTGPPPLPDTGSGLRSGGGARRGPAAQVRAALRLANRVAEETYQAAIHRWHLRRGRVVVCDRYYPADFHAHDGRRDPAAAWDRRAHGWVLRHWFAPPDLLVVLEAPAEVLLARKGEGTLAELAHRQAEYAAYAATVDHVLRVDATAPPSATAAAVIAEIERRRADAPRSVRAAVLP